MSPAITTIEAECLRTFKWRKSEYAGRASISPDGKYVLLGGTAGNLRCWNLQTGKLLHTFKRYNRDMFFSVSISHNGKYAISGTESSFMTWSLQTGKRLRIINEATDPQGEGMIRCVAISPDGKYAISGGWWGMNYWDLQTGKCLRIFSPYARNVSSIPVEDVFSAQDMLSVQISPDGEYAITGHSDGTLRYWNLQTGKLLCTMHSYKRPAPDMAEIISNRNLEIIEPLWLVAFSRDGRYALSGSLSKRLISWDLQAGEKMHEIDVSFGDNESVSFGFGPRGRYALTMRGEVVKLWSLGKIDFRALF